MHMNTIKNLVNSAHEFTIRNAFNSYYGWKPYGRNAEFLEGSQWWTWQKIQELQNTKLRKLINHVYQHVPFYRSRFDEAGLKPGDIQSSDDLWKLPILRKQDIQKNLTDLLAENANKKKLLENHTGGSTGHPLTFYHDDNFLAWGNADLLRNYRMAGYYLGMRWAFLWGSDYDAITHKGLFGYIKDWLIYNTIWVNTFDLTTETLTMAAKKIKEWDPKMLVAYVSSATLFARLIRSKNHGIHPQSIQVSAEVLTPDDRKLLENVFGCPVFDRYGCREVLNIAHECDSHEGLHILAENNIVELLNNEGNYQDAGELGRIVVTNLNNYSMPLIRYEIGDMAIASDRTCSCGRGLPLLEKVVGRTTDVISSPSGKLLHGEFFTHLFYEVKDVKQFRVIQENITDIRLQIVPGDYFDASKSFAFLRERILKHGDSGFNLIFELCEHIPSTKSGKYRFTVSKVPINLGSNE